MRGSRAWRGAQRLAWLTLRAAAGFFCLATSSCSPGAVPPPSKRVILIAIDGGTLPRVRELARGGRLPSFSRVLADGAVGRLASIYSTLPFSPRRGGGYWSPLIWASVATGKEPAVHGIIDFRLPFPETYRICTRPGAREAAASLPRPAAAVSLRIARAAGPKQSPWSVRPGDDPGAVPTPVPETGNLDLSLPASGARSLPPKTRKS